MKHIKHKYNQNRIGGRLLCMIMALLLTASSQGIAQCPPGPPRYDLETQAVFLSPKTSAGIGETITVHVTLVNNGPCIIPKGEATAHVTLSSVFLDLAEPLNFVNGCKSGPWTYVGVVSSGEQHNLFFRNNEGPMPLAGGAFCGFTFEVKGKSATPTGKPSDITVVSGLHPTTTGYEGNINNQFAAAKLPVTGSSAPAALSDFNIDAKDCNAILKWKTSSETTIDSFVVEYSANDTLFNKVGILPAKKSKTGSTYEFANDQGNGRGYYRLKTLYADRRSIYSKTLNTTTTCKVKKGF